MTESFFEEEALGKAYDSRLFKRLLKYLKPFRLLVIFSVILLFLNSGFSLLGPYLTKIAIDKYIAKNDVAGLGKIILIFLTALVLGAGISWLQTYIMEWVGQKTMYNLRMQIFTHLQNLSLSFFDKNPVGRLMTRLTNDVETLNELFTAGVVSVFGDIFTLLGIVVVMLLINYQMALITFLTLPLLFYATLIFRKKVRKSYRDIRTRLAKVNAFLQEHITGMSLIQLFVQEKRTYNRFDKINLELKDSYLKTVNYYAVFFPVVELIGAIALALIIWYGGGQVVKGVLTFGALVAFIQYVDRFFQPISDLSEKYNILQSAMASSERIFKLLDTETDVKPPSSPIYLDQFRGEIEFKNLWFAYKDEEFVLKDISIKVKRGEKIALVGHTGAGKSSIINLLCRFYEFQKGEILIDGKNIREIDPKNLRSQIGLVLQDVFIFSGDIAGNIRLGNDMISDQTLEKAAEEVNAAGFIAKFPNKFKEEVYERGSTLSVGQKQLLAFARALAFDPKILILDEATSSVDTETEILIQDALKKLMKNRTSIVIAHRLSTVQNVDKIIVLHKGEIKEEGSHSELLEKKGLYYKLYQLQYQDQEIKTQIAQ
jgi:ATP-binding cassette subfamily B multidrug efflux pump